MKNILLSFDLEEFDAPLDFDHSITEDQQFRITYTGLDRILSLLNKYAIPATFYTTARWALNYPEIIKTISGQHEIASHCFYHSHFTETDLAASKRVLENITGKEVYGVRIPKMNLPDAKAVSGAGYLYDSSLHPTFMPGRYNHFFKKRTLHQEGSLIEIPASVTPVLRIPLFWISFHNMPLSLYKSMANAALKKDKYLNLYFHPWEFADIKDSGLPSYITRCSGVPLLNKLEKLIGWFQRDGEVSFSTTIKYLVLSSFIT